MRSLSILAVCLTLCCARACAQDPDADPKANTLVDCGPDKAAIFAGTESTDGNYALGWTLRPARKKTPVDWSSYKPEDPLALLDKYPIGPELDPGDYALLDGLIDLRAKRFTAFESKFPYLPNKNHGAFSVIWSDEKREPRYVVVNNDARFFTVNLWLVAIGKQGVHVTDFVTVAEKPVRAFLRKHAPKKHDDYGITYGANSSAGNQATPKLFDKSTVKIPFSADIPKSETDPSYEGAVTVALPKLTILRVTGKKSR